MLTIKLVFAGIGEEGAEKGFTKKEADRAGQEALYTEALKETEDMLREARANREFWEGRLPWLNNMRQEFDDTTQPGVDHTMEVTDSYYGSHIFSSKGLLSAQKVGEVLKIFAEKGTEEQRKVCLAAEAALTNKKVKGYWNVADAEYNLASRFLTVADNVTIGIDNAISPRAGSAYYIDFYDGTVYDSVNITADVKTYTAGYIELTITGHPFNSGDHITISDMSTIDGILASELNAQHGVIKVDANTIRIQTRTTGTAGVTASRTYSYIRDTNTLGGNIIDCAFFQNYVIVFSNTGEIARGHYQTGVKSKIWNIALAAATYGAPRGWGPCDHVSFDTWKQTLIVVNGRNNDKPIEIDNERVSLAPTQYLVDPATSSNTFVYSSDFVLTHGSYLLLIGANNPNTPSTNTPTLTEISAAGTSGVFTGNPNPDDATQIDLGQVTTTVDPHITGVSRIS